MLIPPRPTRVCDHCGRSVDIRLLSEAVRFKSGIDTRDTGYINDDEERYWNVRHECLDRESCHNHYINSDEYKEWHGIKN
jgi:hypothetical protein